MPLSVFLRSIGCKMSLERLPYMNTSIIHTSLFLFSYMPVTCWLHALGTVLKGFCSVLGLFRVTQLHAGYMSCVQITTANDRNNDYKRPQTTANDRKRPQTTAITTTNDRKRPQTTAITTANDRNNDRNNDRKRPQ